MAEKKHVWQIWDNLAFAKSFHSFKMALAPARMVIALATVLLICLIGWLMDLTAAIGRDWTETKAIETIDFSSSVDLRPYANNPQKSLSDIEQYRMDRRFDGVFATLWHFGAARFNSATVSLVRLEITDLLLNIWLCALAIVWAVWFHPVYSIIYFILIAVVVCISGGAICRSAALEFARGEKPGLTESLGFGLKKFKSLITAPLVLTAITAGFGAVVYLTGLIGNIPYAGELFIALTLAAALVFGLLTLLFLIGSIAGANLIFPVIAYEGSDGYDAISRSFCYVYTHPWWMFCYTAIAAAFGTVSYLFVRLFAFGLLITTYILIDLGIFNQPETPGKLARIWARPDFFNLVGQNANPVGLTESAAAFIIYITVLLVVGLVVAFVISFYFCSSTIIYALMRRKVDDIDMSRVYTPLEQVGRGDIDSSGRIPRPTPASGNDGGAN
jgi:hypothetical protein